MDAGSGLTDGSLDLSVARWLLCMASPVVWQDQGWARWASRVGLTENLLSNVSKCVRVLPSFRDPPLPFRDLHLPVSTNSRLVLV